MENLITLNKTAKEVRITILRLLYENQKCHLGPNMSIVEILVALYYDIMSPRDRFISSKGHSAAALFTVLAKRGIIPENKLDDYFKENNLINHNVPGVLFSGGALGQGLSVACGMALADRSRKVYCLAGDGEMQEGNMWEAVAFAAQHKLDNLVLIIDNNGLQAFGRTDDVITMGSFLSKFHSFNWETNRVDGHDFSEILQLPIWKKPSKAGLPTVVVAETIKGKGVPCFEDRLDSHYFNLKEQDYKETIKELNK